MKEPWMLCLVTCTMPRMTEKILTLVALVLVGAAATVPDRAQAAPTKCPNTGIPTPSITCEFSCFANEKFFIEVYVEKGQAGATVEGAAICGGLTVDCPAALQICANNGGPPPNAAADGSCAGWIKSGPIVKIWVWCWTQSQAPDRAKNATIEGVPGVPVMGQFGVAILAGAILVAGTSMLGRFRR